MSNRYVLQARDMSEAIINSEFRGVGDTIEAATYRASRRHGIDGRQLMRIRYHWHEMKDMRVSLWFSVLAAYQRAVERAEKNYQHMRAQHEIDPWLARLADLVAGHKVEREREEK